MNLRRIVNRFGRYVPLTLVAIVLLVPLYWMVATALKSHEQTFALPPEWLPSPFQWDNFLRVFQEVPFAKFTVNTLVIVFWNVVGALLSTTLIAYGFARLRFPGRDKLFLLLLSTLMIPYQITLVPRFILFTKLGWINTYLPLIVPAFTGNAFMIFMVRQYMMSIPMDLDEAAIIDGATRWQILWKVIVPLCTPVLALVTVFTFTWVWNDFMNPLIYLNDPEKFTVTLGLNFFRGAKETSWELLMAASLMATLPPLLVFFFVQRKLVGGIATTGLKG